MHYWALECEERIKLWKVCRLAQGHNPGYVGQEEEKVDIVAMLQRAYLRTVCDIDSSGRWVGSTTACVGLLHRSTLHIANVPPR